MNDNASFCPRSPHDTVEPVDRVGMLGSRLLSAYFLLIGFASILLLILGVLGDPAVQSAVSPPADVPSDAQPSVILAFLDSFGLVVPILLIAMGLVFIRLGSRLSRRNLSAARWAHVGLVWITAGILIASVLRIVDVLRVASAGGSVPADAVTVLVVLGVLLVTTISAYIWLGRNINRAYVGDERLLDDTARLAWSLLIPTLAVVVLVAARPLEQTFIRSLTDKRFASREVPNFVGAENYQTLLGIRFDVVECRREDDGACSLRDNGTIRWNSIDTELLREGYRTAWNLESSLFWGSEHSLAVSSTDADFLRGISTTLVFAVVSVSIELVLALFMAITVNSSFAGRGLMRAVMLIPWAIPTVISARLWELMLKDTSAGIVNRILMDLSLIDQPQAWLSTPSLQLPAAIMVDVWKTTPFMALLLLAGLQLIPRDLYEAAEVDGASRVRQFFSLTIPLLRPTIVVALVFRTLDALRVFDLFNVLFGRQQLTMATYNFEMLVNNQRDGYASAISVMIFILIFIFALLYVRFLRVETN